MTRDKILERVRHILTEALDGATPGFSAEKVQPDARFIEDLGADSLDFIELIMAAEEEFDIAISDEEALQLRTVGQAVEFIEKAVIPQGVES